jgi:hypothetical protein
MSTPGVILKGVRVMSITPPDLLARLLSRDTTSSHFSAQLAGSVPCTCITGQSHWSESSAR